MSFGSKELISNSYTQYSGIKTQACKDCKVCFASPGDKMSVDITKEELVK